MLALIGGKFKGRRLKTPKSANTRPTTSMTRKAVFDICQSIIEDARFLDLFAGTGAMGLEAISRGAAHATFLESDKDALNCLNENIALLNIQNETTVYKGNSLLLMKRLKDSFTIIYIDPPYGKVPLSEILHFFDESSTLEPGGALFLEEGMPSKEKLEILPLKNILHVNSRRFGRSLLHQYIKKP